MKVDLIILILHECTKLHRRQSHNFPGVITRTPNQREGSSHQQILDPPLDQRVGYMTVGYYYLLPAIGSRRINMPILKG